MCWYKIAWAKSYRAHLPNRQDGGWYSLCSQAFGNLGTGFCVNHRAALDGALLRHSIKILNLSQSFKAKKEVFEDNCHSVRILGKTASTIHTRIHSARLGSRRLRTAALHCAFEQIRKRRPAVLWIMFRFKKTPMDKQNAMLWTLSKTCETAWSQHNPIGTGRFSYSTLSNVVLPPLSRAEGNQQRGCGPHHTRRIKSTTAIIGPNHCGRTVSQDPR